MSSSRSSSARRASTSSARLDKTSDKDVYVAKIIPRRGAWLEFEIDKKDLVGVRVDRKRKQPVTVLLKALGLTQRGDPRASSASTSRCVATLEKDGITDAGRGARSTSTASCARASRRRRRPARTLLDNFYFNPKRYDLAKVGRYKINKKLGIDLPLTAVDAHDRRHRRHDQVPRPPARRRDRATTAPEGATVRVETDDIDHFGNRRLRTVGELIQNQIRTGLSRMERVVRERMTTQDVEAITPQTLINIRPVVASIKEFFGTSQLSQFMDQTNPLAGLTHKRRLSALGPGRSVP